MGSGLDGRDADDDVADVVAAATAVWLVAPLLLLLAVVDAPVAGVPFQIQSRVLDEKLKPCFTYLINI